MKRVYFAGSIRGGREDLALYAALIARLRERSEVLTEFIGESTLEDIEAATMTDFDIYERDMALLHQADAVVAECSTPSLGVGYELGSAHALGLPVYVKPVRAGSSFGITRVVKKEDMEQAVKEAFRHDGEVLIEEEISGFEVGCAVMGNEELTLGRVDEIELQKSEGDSFFDYEEKYTLKTSVIHMPARISAEEEARIREAAVKIYRALHCRDFTRVDLFYTDKKEIVFNEVNTIPGFTSHSRFPNMMKGIGSDFAQTVNGIIGAAEKRTEDVKDAAKHGQHNG